MDTYKHWQAKIPHVCTQTPSYIWKLAGFEIESPAQQKIMPGLVCLQSSRSEALTLLSWWWDVNISFSARPHSQSSTRRKRTQSIQLLTTGEECAVRNKITWKWDILSKIFQTHQIDPSFNHLSIFLVSLLLSVMGEYSKFEAWGPLTQALVHPFFEKFPRRSKIFCLWYAES